MANEKQELQEYQSPESLLNAAACVMEQTIIHPLQEDPPSESEPETYVFEANRRDTDSLTKIMKTQNQLSEVKNRLGAIVDTIAENPSIFSRAAVAWGELPLWQKIMGGVALTGPTLAVGLFTHIGVLLVISGVTGIAYTASGIVLDDHHNCSVDIAQRLKDGIFGLADVMQIVIDALDKIRHDLASEIEHFRMENFRLSNNVDSLGDQVESLTSQVEFLVETEKLLREERERLERSAAELSASVAANKELLEGMNQELEGVQKELGVVQKAYASSQEHLSEKVTELQTVRVAMNLEVEKAKRVAQTLEGAVLTLSGTVIAEEEKRTTFVEKLDNFLADEELRFDQVADRICKAEEELSIVKDELERSNARYQELLVRQEEQVARLESLGSKINLDQLRASVNSRALQRNGLYSTTKPHEGVHESSIDGIRVGI